MSEQAHEKQEIELRGIDPELMRSYEQSLAEKTAIDARVSRFSVIGEQAHERIAELESNSVARFQVPIAELPGKVASLVPATEEQMRAFIASVNQSKEDLANLDREYASLKAGE